MSYFGLDPADVTRCPVCGGSMSPMDSDNHRECQREDEAKPTFNLEDVMKIFATVEAGDGLLNVVEVDAVNELATQVIRHKIPRAGAERLVRKLNELEAAKALGLETFLEGVA